MQDQLTLTKKALRLACKHIVDDLSCACCPYDEKGNLYQACLKPEGSKCIDSVYQFYLLKAEGKEAE